MLQGRAGGLTAVPEAKTPMKLGPAVAKRPRKRRLQQPDANLTLPLLPQVTSLSRRWHLEAKPPEYSEPGTLASTTQIT